LERINKLSGKKGGQLSGLKSQYAAKVAGAERHCQPNHDESIDGM